MIKGITFDLWDTVFIDDSDEPKRAAAGQPPKPQARRQLVYEFVNRQQPVSQEGVNIAYDAADAAFRKTWHELHVTWSVEERLGIVLKGIGCELPDSEMRELVLLHENMELEYRPDFIAGVHEILKTLREKYKLCVISDTIFSPGRALRQLLQGEGLLEWFDDFVFSDEVSHSKPEPVVFETARSKMGLEFNELVHIGDRESNDITGPKNLGMYAVLCTAAIDRDSANTRADAMFRDYADLPEIINQIANR